MANLRALLPPLASFATLCTVSAFAVPRHDVAPQKPDYVSPLVTPPPNVGQCLPPEGPRMSGEKVARGSRLQVIAGTPARERDMEILVDQAGKPRIYTDYEIASPKQMSGNGEHIMAIFAARGGMHGFRSRVGGTARKDLDAKEQQRVRELADWLRRRCPG